MHDRIGPSPPPPNYPYPDRTKLHCIGHSDTESRPLVIRVGGWEVHERGEGGNSVQSYEREVGGGGFGVV